MPTTAHGPCSLLTLLALLAPLTSQSGLPDPTLAGEGFVRIGVGLPRDAKSLALQADGRIVFVGSAATAPNGSWVVGRCLDDGSLDTGFGSGGLVTIAGGWSGAEASDVAIDPQGRIVVSGRDIVPGRSTASFALRRFLSNGAVDISFGNGGLAAAAIDYTAWSTSLVLVPASSPWGYAVVVAGHSFPHNGGSRLALAQFTDEGVLDTAHFGAWTNKKHIARTGYVIDGAYGNSMLLTGSRIGVAADGKLVLAAYITSVIDSSYLIARYLPDGSVDNSFGTGGHVLDSVQTGMGSRQPRGCMVQPDGKIVVVGRGRGAGETNIGSLLLRYHVNGSRDTGFGSNGLVQTGRGYENQPACTVERSIDGRLTMVTTAVIGGDGQLTSFRFLADGSPDPSYGTGGQGAVFGVVPSAGNQSYELAWRTSTDALGRVVCAGYSAATEGAYYLVGRILP